MENLEVMVILFIIVILGYVACKLGYMGMGLISMDYPHDFRCFMRTATFIAAGKAGAMKKAVDAIPHKNIRALMLGLEIRFSFQMIFPEKLLRISAKKRKTPFPTGARHFAQWRNI